VSFPKVHRLFFLKSTRAKKDNFLMDQGSSGPSQNGISGASPAPIDSKDFVEHIRTVHFTLLVTCIALAFSVLYNRPDRLQRALADLRTIQPMALEMSDKEVRGKALSEFQRLNLITNEKHLQRVTFSIGLINETNLVEVEYNSIFFFDGFQQLSLTHGGPPATLSDFEEGWNILSGKDFNLSIGDVGTNFSSKAFLIQTGLFWIRTTNEAFLNLVGPSSGNGSWAASEMNCYFNLFSEISGVPKLLVTRQYSGPSFGPIPDDEIVDPSKDHYELFFNFTDLQNRIDMQKIIASPFLGKAWRHGSFSTTFPELAEVTKFTRNLPFDQIEEILQDENLRNADKLEAFGLKIPAQGISLWGALILIGIQVYLNRHLKFLNSVHVKNLHVARAAWLGLYTDYGSIIITILTMALLPVAVEFIIAYCLPLSQFLLGRAQIQQVVLGVCLILISILCSVGCLKEMVSVWNRLKNIDQTL
jgi:hypothetical protein